jgi:CcmD family protein
MDNIEYLFAGFAVVWACIFIYLLLLQGRLRSLQHEIERLEERLEEAERTSAGTPPAGNRQGQPRGE